MVFTKNDPNINRAGRPKGAFSIVAMLKEKLQEVPKGQKKTYAKLLIDRILKKAIVDGDSQMITKIWQYIDGMPKRMVEQTNDNIQRVVIYKPEVPNR